MRSFDELVVKINLFYLRFGLFAQFIAFAVKKFNTVIVVRVVRGADHDARVAAHIFGEKRYRGSRHRADLTDVVAHGREPRDDGGLDHVAAFARVFA